MHLAGRIAVAALAMSLLGAAPAVADDFCVGSGSGCVATLAEALEAAAAHPGADRVLLGEGDHEVPAGAADATGEPVEIVGAGAATRLTAAAGAAATLELAEPGSRASGLALLAPGAGALETLRLAGVATNVTVALSEEPGAAAARLLAGARLEDAVLLGPVATVAPARIERSVLTVAGGAALTVDGGTGDLIAENLEITVSETAAAALDVRCASLVARHLTVTGTASRAATVACADAAAALDLRDSVVHGEFADVVATEGEATAKSSHSAHDEDEQLVATARLSTEDPGFVSAQDLRPRPGSPLVDAGEPAPLQPGEGFWDLAGRTRMADGDADGAVRRDVGAHELQPAATAPPAGNVLFNPDAELGAPIDTTGEGPAPPGWTRTGAFTQVAYGTTTRTAQGADLTLPTRAAGEALGGGRAFFSAGPGPQATLVQRIDVAGSAREIDTGAASAALSGLLGGYGADEDQVRVTATYRDPAGGVLGTLGLGPVTPAERGNATNLLARAAAGAIPARTRAIDVEIAGTRVSAPGSSETYADGYADNLALVLSVPGVPVPGPVDPEKPPVKNLRPFAGVTVLTGRPRLSRTGRTRVRLACASATVGRCTGTLELRAQIRRGLAFSRIARFARFSLAPGRSATVRVRLTLTARRALRRRKAFRATLRAVARDGQGLERRSTIPVRVVRSRRSRR